jgi:SAM-dependent methyltransferase
MDPRRIVAAGYDAMAERYLEWSGLRPSPTRLRYLARAIELIPAGADVLELGCGAGIPMTRALAEGRRVTGVDISATQIGLARRNVPDATFRVADMTTLDVAPSSLDAVVAFYSLTHVPREDHAALLAAIRRWLRPGGLFLASMGADDEPGDVERDWLGVDMYFSHFGPSANRRLVARAGFEIVSTEIAVEPEDRHDARFLWVVARAPAS